MDTAGLREAAEEVEQLGIHRSREALADAALVLIVLDATEPLNDEERRLLAAVENRPAVVAVNKCDLLEAGRLLPETTEAPGCPIAFRVLCGMGGNRHTQSPPRRSPAKAFPRCASAFWRWPPAEPRPSRECSPACAINKAIATALEALADAAQANAAGIPHEMILLDLYRALWALDSLTGQTTSDDILNLIFSTFCIGK